MTVRLKVILSSSSSSSGKGPHKPFDKSIGGFQRREICSLYRAGHLTLFPRFPNA
jgi:hypothetical protein